MAQLNLHHGKGLAITIGADADVWEFVANGAVTAGQVVKLDSTQTGEKKVQYVAQGAADGLSIGVALETVASGATVRVCVAGYIEGVKITGTTGSAGDSLAAGANGAVIVYTAAATDRVVGTALADEDTDAGSIALYWFRVL